VEINWEPVFSREPADPFDLALTVFGSCFPPRWMAHTFVLRGSRSERPFASSFSRHTISVVLRMSALTN
jgi:hypothetical protein